MKTILILLLSLISSSMVYSQMYTFPSYGLVNNYTNGSVLFAPSKLTIEKKPDNSFEIKAYDPRDGSVSMECLVKYKLFNAEYEYYVFDGTLNFGEIGYNCIIRTKIKMSDFVKGIGNASRLSFEKKYEIKILYSRYGKTPEDMEDTVSIFPTNIKNE